MIECGENCRFRTGGRAFHRQGNLGVGNGTCTRPARILWGVEFGAGNLDKMTQVLIERVIDSDELLPIQQCGHGFPSYSRLSRMTWDVSWPMSSR